MPISSYIVSNGQSYKQTESPTHTYTRMDMDTHNNQQQYVTQSHIRSHPIVIYIEIYWIHPVWLRVAIVIADHHPTMVHSSHTQNTYIKYIHWLHAYNQRKPEKKIISSRVKYRIEYNQWPNAYSWLPNVIVDFFNILIHCFHSCRWSHRFTSKHEEKATVKLCGNRNNTVGGQIMSWPIGTTPKRQYPQYKYRDVVHIDIRYIFSDISIVYS